MSRVGYAYELSPASATTSSVYVDADRHIFGVGVGVAWTRRAMGLHLDGFSQLHHLARATRTGGDVSVFGITLGIDL